MNLLNFIRMRPKAIFYSIVFILFFNFAGLAQEIKKEVKVVKPYEPTLSDAVKISAMPKINDTTTISPHYSYAIVPHQMYTEFELRPIRAAKMIGEPLPKLYKSHIKMGFGNYFTPLFELSVHTLRSKNHALGFDFGHLSSHGKIKLDNNEKVFAGYSDNSASLYGKKIFKKSVLNGNINFLSKTVYYYGYNPSIDTTLEKKDIHQNFLNLNFNASYSSVYTDSSHLNYKVAATYDYFTDKNNNTEKGINITGKFDKIIGIQDIGLSLDIMHYITSMSVDSSNNTIIGISPWFSRHSNEWRFHAGFNTFFDIHNSKTQFHFSPCVQLQFIVVEKILIPYFGVDGKYEANSYKKIALENPYIIPQLHVDNTNHKIITYIGIKGRYSNAIAFNLKASYSIIDDMYFYVNDTNCVLQNQLSAIKDNVELAHIYSEISYYYSSNLHFFLTSNYYNFKLNNQEYAWHKPSFDITLSGRYNLRNKIFIRSDLYGIGKRYAENYTNHKKELPGIIDLNISLEYRYTKNLSAFLLLNNILGTNYYHFNHYPSQKFNFLAGFTYSL